jgi:hypothetical protein
MKQPPLRATANANHCASQHMVIDRTARRLIIGSVDALIASNENDRDIFTEAACLPE